MVWLKLHHKQDESPVLINTENIADFAANIVGKPQLGTVVVYKHDKVKRTVKESLDEIEIMLRAKGEDVRRADPRGREVIGQQHPDFQSPDSSFAKRGV